MPISRMRPKAKAARKLDRLKKAGRAMLYGMSTSAGARDGLRWQEYAANVKAQKGFSTRELQHLRTLWLADKKPPNVLAGFAWMRDVDWAAYLKQTRAAWDSFAAATNMSPRPRRFSGTYLR